MRKKKGEKFFPVKRAEDYRFLATAASTHFTSTHIPMVLKEEEEDAMDGVQLAECAGESASVANKNSTLRWRSN